MRLTLDPVSTLPEDAAQATLVGRVWRPDLSGPSVIAIRDGRAFDISDATATTADLLNAPDPVRIARDASGDDLGPVAALIANSGLDARDPAAPWLLAPCDLQAVKACGVTFAASLLERVIEEQAKGDASAADAIRQRIGNEIGTDLGAIVPGSEAAMRLKEALIARNAWSQYLEVGIGPDAEVFTKAQPMSSVGTGAEVGIHPQSVWNNPEPEVVLALSADGRIVGASLGNDVNLRDVEGRSALLLGKAKDNNASCAIGPFIRLIDERYTLDDLRATQVGLRVEGDDQFVLEGSSSLALISRDIADLAAQTIGANHQYPDGAMLFTGTMFAPVKDRGAAGKGFTHSVGDIVTVASPRLGALVNRVTTSDRAEPWVYGTGALMRNLAGRGLL
ncbi:MAG: fumarylacetoacetate hydrolase family protein [Alphaproteobacteria bacterium]